MEETDISFTPNRQEPIAPQVNAVKNFQENDPYKSIKTGIWIYLILLIFEGALRKWFLPALAAPLLIIRDPVAIWLIYTAWKKGVFVFNIYVNITCLISVVAFFTAMFLGHGSLWVAIYGVRTLLLHFILIFVIGNVFNRQDVIKVGKFLVWLTIPMTMLIIVQFYSPQSAFVNRGVGGDVAGGGFSGALGFFRPPATFSFTNGTSLYYSLAACFIFYFWFDATSYVKKTILIASSIALLMSIPLSISRTLFFSVLLTALFLSFAVLKKRGSVKQLIIVIIALLIIVTALSQLKTFQTATDAFTARFTNASESEGGLEGTFLNRFLGGLLQAITNSNSQPFFGYGTGMGTNVGSQLLTGKSQFLIAEGEWARLVGEMGLLMGIIVILIRLTITLKLVWASFKKISSDILPWLVLSSCVITLPQAQWAQPTALGFSVIAAGLTIAAFRNNSTKENLNTPKYQNESLENLT